MEGGKEEGSSFRMVSSDVSSIWINRIDGGWNGLSIANLKGNKVICPPLSPRWSQPSVGILKTALILVYGSPKLASTKIPVRWKQWRQCCEESYRICTHSFLILLITSSLFLKKSFCHLFLNLFLLFSSLFLITFLTFPQNWSHCSINFSSLFILFSPCFFISYES